MKQCPVCGLTVEDREPFCPRCSADLTHVPPLPPQAQPVQPLAPAPPPTYVPRPQPARRPFTWADVATFLGFCSSIVGYFGASLLFFPLGILASVLGFKGDRARGPGGGGHCHRHPGAAVKADVHSPPGGVPSRVVHQRRVVTNAVGKREGLAKRRIAGLTGAGCLPQATCAPHPASF